jgi:hypothetical protein
MRLGNRTGACGPRRSGEAIKSRAAQEMAFGESSPGDRAARRGLGLAYALRDPGEWRATCAPNVPVRRVYHPPPNRGAGR